MVNVYIVCRDEHPLYEKYLQNLSGDQVKVVGVYLAPENTKPENRQFVLGYALACAQNCGANVIICEQGLSNREIEEKCWKEGIKCIVLETLFALQIKAFFDNKVVAQNLRWFAHKIVGSKPLERFVVFSPKLFDLELEGLDGKTLTPEIGWLSDQLYQVSPVTPIEVISDPDFIKNQMPQLPATTLLIASSFLWRFCRKSTQAMFLPIPFSSAAYELIQTNPLAFEFSLEKLRLDIEKLSESV